MKTKFLFVIALIAGSFLNFVGCTDKSYEVTPHPVTLSLPSSNSDPELTLGRVLFYDAHLSVNNSISCASCHKQALGFSDNVAHSTGFENRLTPRNALPIQNLQNSFGFSPARPPELFWDGRETFLETMVLRPILNHVEMGMSDEAALVDRVRNLPYYHDLFQQAFGTTNVTSSEIASALSDFVGRITSTNSRFNQSQSGQGELKALERQGQQLFIEKYNCDGCHKVSTGSSYFGSDNLGFINIGLDPVYADPGRMNVTHLSEDAGKFKVPSLANVALTAPYMHDGRFATLHDVLDHYSHGIANHPNLDARLKNADGSPLQMNISEQEKTALIAFLNTLTDFSVLSNSDFSNPFVIH